MGHARARAPADRARAAGERTGALRAARLAAVLALIMTAPAAASAEEAPGGLRRAAEEAGLHVGVAVSRDVLRRRGDLVAETFTSLTAENAMKWSRLAPTPNGYSFRQADALVLFAEANDMRVRGHTLFWTKLNGLPDWLKGDRFAEDEEAMRAAMRRHARTVLSRYRGHVAQWDVVNEPLEGSGALDASNNFHRALGPGWVAEAFAMAEAADPEAELYLNEVGAVLSDEKFDGLEALARDLVEAGAPIDGVGLQGHLWAAPDRDALVDKIERLGALGLNVELTEVDVPIHLFEGSDDPLEAQAQAYADIFEACLDAEACRGVTVWGLTDARTWLDAWSRKSERGPARPLLFDESLRPKPAYHAVVETLRHAAERP